MTSGDQAFVDRVDVQDRELEVRAAAKGLLEQRRSEAPAGSRGFLQHEVRSIEGEVREPLGPTLEHHAEAEQSDVEVERDVETGEVELRYEKLPTSGRSAHVNRICRPSHRREDLDTEQAPSVVSRYRPRTNAQYPTRPHVGTRDHQFGAVLLWADAPGR